MGAQNRAPKTRGAKGDLRTSPPPPKKILSPRGSQMLFQRSPRAICNIHVSRLSSYTISAEQCSLKTSITLAMSITKPTVSQASVLPAKASESGISSLP